MRRVGKGLPDFFRRVAQFSHENERPLFSILSYLRPAGRTRCVLLTIGHILLLGHVSIELYSSVGVRAGKAAREFLFFPRTARAKVSQCAERRIVSWRALVGQTSEL